MANPREIGNREEHVVFSEWCPLSKDAHFHSPTAGDEVTVHYVGTLQDGQEFDSSRSRSKAFTFTLGQGQVIPGWDLGVASMRKGEVAKFTLAPEFAYGDAGGLRKCTTCKASFIQFLELENLLRGFLDMLTHWVMQPFYQVAEVSNFQLPGQSNFGTWGIH